MISHDSMPQNMDLQQMMLALDPQKALQNMYMNQGMANGSPSPSSQPSSGAASTVGNNNGETAGETPSKAPTPAADFGNMQNIFAGLMPQLGQNNLPPNMQNLLEQMTMGGMPMFNPLAALQGNGLLGMNGSPTKFQAKLPKEMKATPPQNPLNFGFPFNLAPSTSTASQQSVIVSHNGDGDVTPPQKRMKMEDDEDRKVFDNALMASLATGNTACDECGKECGNTLALITHKAQEHSEEKKAASPVAFKCNECDKEFQSGQFLEQHKMLQHNPVTQRLLAMGMPPGFPPFNLMLPNLPQQFMPDFDPAAAMAQLATPKQPAHIKRQYSSNGKNYCDLCNKEVCNKYFLRTHMLKMHGIVIDENKTVIGNIDTLEKERQGALSFRCDICHMELKSRNLLRQHKQDSHGVMPLATPRSQKTSIVGPPSMVPASLLIGGDVETKCPMCDKRVSSNQLALHIQTDHAGDLPSMILPQTPTSPIIECKLCSHVSKDESEHQLHQLSTHTADYLQMQLKEERSRMAEADPSLLRCGQCQYTTKDQKNMEMHAERHDRMNEAKQQLEAQDYDEDDAMKITAEAAFKMAVANQLIDQGSFKCGVCSTTYPDEASLDAHAAVAHNGLNLTVPKKETVEAEKTIERNSHTSGSVSPASESLAEGFVKAADKNHVMQNFLLRITDPQGIFVAEVVAQLPVKSLASGPAQLLVEAIPQ